jgi:hypothetical protein
MGFIGNLQDQFASRCNNEHPGGSGGSFPFDWIGQHPGQHSDEKGGGFAGTGLGAAKCIPALQGGRHDLGLDGGAVFEPGVGNGMQHRVGKIQIMEPGLTLLPGHLEQFRVPRNGRWRRRVRLFLGRSTGRIRFCAFFSRGFGSAACVSFFFGVRDEGPMLLGLSVSRSFQMDRQFRSVRCRVACPVWR